MSSLKDKMYSPKEKNIEKLNIYLKNQKDIIFDIFIEEKKNNNI